METDLERYIREFVWEKAQERVQLHLTPELHLRHVTRRGATLLAAFWANLLQHYRNYPTDKYRYRKVSTCRPNGLSFRFRLREARSRGWTRCETVFDWPLE